MLPGREQWQDLSSEAVGGQAVECNNMHFGDMSNLLSLQPVANMGDGWETRRRRHPGNDWVILKLGRKGSIGRIELDTAFFRGNYPIADKILEESRKSHPRIIRLRAVGDVL